MKVFINKPLMLLLVAMLVTGCTPQQVKPQPEGVAEQQAEQVATEQPETIEAEELTQPPVIAENPYLTQSKPVTEQERVLFQNGLAAFKADKLEQARQAFTELHALNPELSGPVLNLALVARAQSQDEEFIKLCQQAIAINRNNLEAYNVLAVYYREQGSFTEAESLWLKTLELWPRYASGYLNLGILYELYLGRLPEALQNYQQYQALQDTEDRKVKGWILDLQRRMPAPEPEKPQASAVGEAS